LLLTSCLVVAAVAWLTFVHPSMHWRQVVVSALLAVLIGSSARAILRRDGPRGAIARLTGGLFVAGTTIMIFRSVSELIFPMQAVDLLELNLPQVLCFAMLGMLPTLSTVGFLLMCTERSQLALESAARHDHLTGIYNRRALEELAHQAMAAARRHGTPLAILIIDVDHFKRINDELGHHAGDIALIEAVGRIRASLRAEDLVGRLGGEEFVAVLPNTDGSSGLATAERVREAFDGQPMHGGETPLMMTVSVGVSVLVASDTLFTHLLRRADRAMYAAKAAGRNCVMADAGALTSG
jgi:diguanylate cyclase (GGDEF)-like protein